MTESIEWFVQMSLGPQLGPMSRGDLEELARSGAVLKTDQVRQGENGHWRPASELRGLFDSPPEPALNTGPEKTRSGTKSEPAVAVPPPQEEPEQPKPVEDSLADRSEEDVTEASPEISEEAAELNVLLPSPQESSPEIDEEDFELNLPRPLSSNEPLQEVTEPVDSATETSPPDEEPPVEDSVVRESPSPAKIPPPLSSQPMSKPLSGLDAASPTPPEAQPPQQRWAKHVPRWAPRAIGLTAVLIGTALAFPLLVPDPDPDIYNRFSKLYSEWLQHRLSVATDPWPEFVERAKSELDESLSWLEEHTEPENRRRSLLLFAGRDLRKALDSPPGEAAPGERRLKGLFEQLDAIHTPKE